MRLENTPCRAPGSQASDLAAEHGCAPTTATLARLGCPPEEIMAQLGGVVATHGEEAGATCLYAAYDPASRRCRLTSAGHLPPALRHPGGRVEFLDLPGEPDRPTSLDPARSICDTRPGATPMAAWRCSYRPRG
jgi:Stage II sporulation protein E (SpoIIE)